MLSVALGPSPQGDLSEDVKPDDCSWSLVDGKMVEIYLLKQDGMHWWGSVVKGTNGDVMPGSA